MTHHEFASIAKTGEELHDLIKKDDRGRHEQDTIPLVSVEFLDVEDHLGSRPGEHEDVLDEGAGDGEDEPGVGPRGKGEEGLALGDSVEGVEHLDRHEDRQGERARPLVVEHFTAVPVGELGSRHALHVPSQLTEGHARSLSVDAHPPHVPPHRRNSNVDARQQVPGQHPAVHKLLVSPARREGHDAGLCGVEGESSGREPVGDEVDPEEGDGAENLGEAEEDGEEDADDLADVGGDEITDKRLGVGVDRPTLLHSPDDADEVVISQYHLRCSLRHRRPAPHGHSDGRCLEGRSVVDSIARHRRCLAGSSLLHRHLQELDDVLLVDGLGAREELRRLDRLPLLLQAHRRPLLARKALAFRCLPLLQHSDHPADRLCSLGVVSCDDHDADARALACLDGSLDLLAGRIEDPSQPHERQVALDLLKLARVLQARV
mmetsp:Transcript_4428/g.16160  ORF Transcript_4428/g.16160 Transcript_4428/m.16160 type:complete len:433 (-) Transcript_4428:1982-3280(-)